MSFLPPESRAALFALGNYVDAKMSRLKHGADVETERFRQAQYINWCTLKLIPDPCGADRGYERIAACFAENLIMDCNSHSATVQGYAASINKLFEMRGFPIPADISDKNNMVSKIIHACEREETIARRRSPITKEMYVVMAKLAKTSLVDSAESVVFEFFNLIRVGGFRVAEYAQTTQTRVDEFEYASGNKVIKAFIPTDWKFYNGKDRLITTHSLDGLYSSVCKWAGKLQESILEQPKKLKITFRIQKNRQNGQSISFVADDKHPAICPVRSAYKILLRAKRLGQSDTQPMGVFVNANGIVEYLTGNNISEVLQSVAIACHADLTKDEIMRFSSHSGRVWAVVILDEAGMQPDFIKSRLRWMGDSYRLYLRDTSILQQKHLTALDRASTEFTTLFGENRMTLPDVVPVDNTMDSY